MGKVGCRHELRTRRRISKSSRVYGRAGGADHAEPSRAAKRAVARADAGGDRGPPTRLGPSVHARDRGRRGRPRLLGRPRSVRDDRARQGVPRRAVRHLHGDDGDDPRAAPAGHRPGERDRYRGRLPAGRGLRPRGGGRGDSVRHPRREDRPVLLDADGAGLPRGRAQARHADAADRRADRHRHRARLGPRQPSRSRR